MTPPPDEPTIIVVTVPPDAVLVTLGGAFADPSPEPWVIRLTDTEGR
jgi:hypothetical protein